MILTDHVWSSQADRDFVGDLSRPPAPSPSPSCCLGFLLQLMCRGGMDGSSFRVQVPSKRLSGKGPIFRIPREDPPLQNPSGEGPPSRTPRGSAPFRSPRRKSPVRTPLGQAPRKTPREKSPHWDPQGKVPTPEPLGRSPRYGKPPGEDPFPQTVRGSRTSE